MDSEYDCKFEEMKKYIPFLESMIKRLESTTSTSNPRQAQLDKIRSLRDLLMDKKKRMKMENLLKCEQVLLNLYAKVEQRDSLVGPKKETTSETSTTNLNVVRNKLKSVVSKLNSESDDTLPEIARASETEEICVPGSKEPALFQRRPNIPSIPTIPTAQLPSLKKDPSPQNVKRNYTRLLLSPERNSKTWTKDESLDEKPLFIRRSPKNSPKKRLPSYHRKERKKDDTNVSQSKDLNITLNVPEESLLSLNTKDIVSRIINCNDNDVDIDTLRGLRSQILGELKETGAKDDISDIILKSYKKKDKKEKKNEEVEEGELSDSESEAIENIYGSLVIMDKDKSSKNIKTETTDNTQCKIQICLVINSDKPNQNPPDDKDNKVCNVDTSDFETFHKVKDRSEENKPSVRNEKDISTNEDVVKKSATCQSSITETFTEETKKIHSPESSCSESKQENNRDGSDSIESINNNEMSNLITSIKPNFYKPISEDFKNKDSKDSDNKSLSKPEGEKELSKTSDYISENDEKINKKYDVEIPLLDSPTIPQQNIVNDVVSEIDILQALKKEILSETSNVLNTDVVTPLFMPIITKVTNAQEIGCKKRISIEKYKAKTVTNSISTSHYVTDADVLKKQSLKLTEKECERFNFLSKLSLNASSDEEEKSNMSMDDIYGNLAPKSPDHDDFADKGLKPPVIIPSDPVETPVISSEADVDMRNILPQFHTQETASKMSPLPSFVENGPKISCNENNLFKNVDTQVIHLVDPRMKRESNQLNTQVNDNVSFHLNQILPGVPGNLIQNMTANKTPVPMSPNLIPNMTPNRPQNRGNMTPNMTPSRSAFDHDDGFKNKHVYAPTYQSFDTQSYKEKSRISRWGCEKNTPFWEDVGVSRNRSNKIPIWENDIYPRNTSNNMSIWEEGNSSGSMQSNSDYTSTYDQRYDTFNDPRDPYVRKDCMPSKHHFSRMDCPATPTPSFGRIDPPMTPIHSFGRSDCPPTPNHPFGRQDPPNVMSNIYGGSDYTQLPSNQIFCNKQDPRLNRNPDYDNNHGRDRERHNFYESDQNNRYSHSDSYRRFQREQSVGRNERTKTYDKTGRDYREQQMRRETMVGRTYNKDVEGERSFTKNRGNSRGYDYRPQNESKAYDENKRRGYQQEKLACRNTRDISSPGSQISPSSGCAISKENKLNVDSHSGHVFTIDNKTTMQEKNKNDNLTFDARRQRAASVGRSLPGESTSRGHHESKQFSKMSESENKHKHFRRASSVGREVGDSKSDFKDIKASLKSFKLKSDSRVATYFEKKNESLKQSKTVRNLSRKEINDADDKSVNTKGKYSPRKNNRDPRMRHDSYDRKNKYRDHNRSNSSESKNCGIVYSNDNITKGTILGSGYGVKNYKIPKIKRNIPVAESGSNAKSTIDSSVKEIIKNESKIDEENIEDKNKHLSIKLTESSLIKDKKITEGKKKQNRDKHEKNIQKNNNIVSVAFIESNDQNEEIKNNKQVENKIGSLPDSSFENNDRRLTRSARRNLGGNKSLLEISPVKRTRKPKKASFFESDSDDNDIKKTVKENDSLELTSLNEIESKNEPHKENSSNISNPEMQLIENMETLDIDNIDNNTFNIEDENPLESAQSLSALEKQRISVKNELLFQLDSDDNDIKKSIKKNNSSEFTKSNEIESKNKTNVENSSNASNPEMQPIENLENLVIVSNDNITFNVADENLIESTQSLSTLEKQRISVKNELLFQLDSDDNDIKKSINKNNSSEFTKSNEIKINNPNVENSSNASNPEMQPIENLENLVIVSNDNITFNVADENPIESAQSLSTLEKQKISAVSGSEEEALNTLNIISLGDFSKKVKESGEELDTNFGMDDLEIFSDNITSDPVIDNINALIADLDDDLASNKNLESSKNQFTQELNMETMLENISNPEICNNKNGLNLSETSVLSVEKTLSSTDAPRDLKALCNKNPLGICLVSTTDEKESLSNKVIVDDNHLDFEQSQKLPNNIVPKIQDEMTNEIPVQTTEADNNYNEGVVSTTDNKDQSVTQEKTDCNNVKDTVDKGNHSTAPDSTIQISDNVHTEVQKIIPDSTDKLPNEMMNSDVTSTHNVNIALNKDLSEPILSNTDTSEIKNIGKLLSILQDKSKIKELLGLLGEQSNETDKIKKKLEKLSEIISDDEDSTKVDDGKEKTYDNLSSTAIKETQPMTQQSSQITNEEVVSNANDTTIKDDLNSKDEGTDGFFKLLNRKTDSVVPLKSEDILINKEDQHNMVEKIKTNIKKTVKNTTAKKGKKKNLIKNINAEDRRLTRSDASGLLIETPTQKKSSRELENLKRDIKEMFIRDDILNATGLRMCRIAKLVDEKPNKQILPESAQNENEPVVVLKKCKNLNMSEESQPIDKVKMGKGVNPMDSDIICKSSKNSETKLRDNNRVDPYDFETDSLNETNNTSERNDESSESDFESMSSSKSFGSTEQLSEVKKKPKRKRGKGWKAGIIKVKKKKTSINREDTFHDDKSELQTKPGIEIPDLNCFIDKTYYFHKQNTNYDCRLCVYKGVDIVNHYKKQHPHTEIPCARMSPSMAQEAIKESEEVNFQAISGISSKKYVCRFCFKEFSKKKPLIEAFFWHVVSMHTGEYKQHCSECVNINRCPFNLDIPPPPKEAKGQLLGYICEKCNYTQISLENLKTHVIVRHNDEQTAVYTINLAVMTKKSISALLKQWETENETETPRVLRSSRSNKSLVDNFEHQNNSKEESTSNVNVSLIPNKAIEYASENNEPILKTNKIQSKITFENDNFGDISNYENNDSHDIKLETQTNDNENESEQDVSFGLQSQEPELDTVVANSENSLNTKSNDGSTVSDDIFDYPHFKIKYSNTGSKDYICCINGNEHYRTTLLISFKKHVQLRHSEKWDGYCFVCKVIVTPQGKHLFKDCLQHFLDKHMDNFPILEESKQPTLEVESKTTEFNSGIQKSGSNAYINVRPLSQLISNECSSEMSEISVLPVIESVISLGTRIEPPQPSPSYPNIDNSSINIVKRYKYEEAQAEMMTKKHRVVLDAMMAEIKLGHVFKCAGRFCSFTTDSAEDALLHASTHARLGGEDSLNCVYCDFDSHQNAIDLITHVFKSHGSCQYVCGLCFYRAAASQLVNAHIKRVHEAATSVTILRTTFKTGTPTEEKMLSREEAVPHYICCGDSDSEGVCKFRTYTPGKFCEHLQLRHSAITELKCFMCTSNFKTPADLIRHLKTHGLKLYQCSWCVYGADNEAELLAHASAFHPTQQPKAYLRIITNKEGSSELRVLPLAHLNKSDVPAVDIAPTKFKDNPVREAERSIELEKLIGQTTLMIESMASSVDTNTTDKQTSEQELIIPRTSTPIPQVQEATETEKQNQIKTEPLTPEKSSQAKEVVYCLDSDDDGSLQKNVASNNNSGNRETKVPVEDLFLCAKCKMVLNTGIGLKRHMFWCYAKVSDPISCAHCSIKLPKANLVNHYLDVHSLESKIPKKSCSKCPREFSSISELKAHRKAEHSNAANKSVDGALLPSLKQYTASSGKLKRPLASKEKIVEPPEKTRKFGPQDVDQLPINPILDDFVFCALCEFNTKVRLNMVRHLQLHAQQQPVPQTAPVNPVPHLETNEKHFDKMVNLASSSIVTRTPDKNKTENNTATTLLLPDVTSRFPKYVPEKHRLTCGAKGCSYTSVDESMLKYHWETLHHGATDFHCVHCPPRQNFDMSQPLTLSRIMAHLKMHDSKLYACSFCTYYHHKREIVQKHLNDLHQGGQVMIVREGVTGTASTSQVHTPAPTMDLKPWHCGLCSFKSLLRPEVVNHCAKEHNSKMQYKCAYCAFRTSNAENITKHQSKSHPSNPEEIFYYYYREGSVPDESDGTERWQKQSQKTDTSEIKIETSSITPPPLLPLSKPVNDQVDLNLVKKEIIEPVDVTIEDLCREFGEFCEPNGLNYKCSLCKNVIENNIEAIQSHLYEELKYRKWGCSICSYKAFHKAGLSEHMIMEHRQNRDPIALPVDHRIEMWVNKLLEYQTSLIDKYKENLVKQKEEILRSNPGTSFSKPQTQQSLENKTNDTLNKTNNATNKTIEELEKLFGSFGAPVGGSFCCPKCNVTFKDEDLMQNHLEGELNKIRWYCSACFVTFQTYHEAQFHCRSAHASLRPAARPAEAPRDAGARCAWRRAVLAVQRRGMEHAPRAPAPHQPAPDNSLLVVRYEEKVPTPEVHLRTPSSDHDSDDEKLVIDEPLDKRMAPSRTCHICGHVSNNSQLLRNHALKHYNLRPFDCGYCSFNGARRSVVNHQKKFHALEPLLVLATAIPKETPSEYIEKRRAQDVNDEIICLVCQRSLHRYEVEGHVHGNAGQMFGKRGDIYVKCNACSLPNKDFASFMEHHKTHHPTVKVSYDTVTLSSVPVKETGYKCNTCITRFTSMKDLRTHIRSKCSGQIKKPTTVSTSHEIIVLDDEQEIGRKRKIIDVPSVPYKKVARKSTTKLPHSRFARKSTTKLPFNSPNEGEEYSFYGTKPTSYDLNAITTMMPFCNTMVPFTLKKLNEIININPVVLVDIINPNPN